MRKHYLGATLVCVFAACAVAPTLDAGVDECPVLLDCGAGGTTGAGGTGGAGGTAGAGGLGGEIGTGGRGGADGNKRCDSQVATHFNSLLQLGSIGIGFGYAPELEHGPVSGSVDRVDGDGLLVALDDGGFVRLGWPDDIALDVPHGARVEAFRNGGWDILKADTFAVAVFVDDVFTAPAETGSLPGGPAIEFSFGCYFDEEITTQCGRPPPDESIALRLAVDGQFISPRESAEVGRWKIWNVVAIQQLGYRVGDCLVEPRFFGTIAAVRSGAPENPAEHW